MKSITFFVPGTPAPGGSKRYVGHSKKGRAILIDMGGKRTKTWRAVVAQVAALHFKQPLSGLIRLDVCFWMPRPKKHFNRLGLREDAPTHHGIRPDATKLLRSTEDALTGIAWVDDARIVQQSVVKRYVHEDGESGAQIVVSELACEVPTAKARARRGRKAA